MKKKSPLIGNPLRTPGQSLDEEIQEILDGEVFSYLFIPLVMAILVFYNWLLWFQIIQLPNPTILTFALCIISIFSVYKILKLKKRIKKLRLGRDGEKAVGQTLDALRAKSIEFFTM